MSKSNKNILILNEISPAANDALGSYKLTKDCTNPEAIMLRSFDMHSYKIPPSTLCVGRAGAGVNNIPIADYSSKGIVVFNTPGANANAVKELAICALLLASRKIVDGIAWAQGLKGKGAEVAKLVESGKGQFVGPELTGKKLGVIGLGAIGALVANAAVELDMKVIGYDPHITIDGAWHLSNSIEHETDLNRLLSECDFVSLHAPLVPATKEMLNAKTIASMKSGAAVINCSRGELVNNKDIVAAIKSGKISRYVTDFPVEDLLGVPGVIPIPHLGASTPEAEDNCAYMAAKQIVDYLDNGNIKNSVNFPSCNVRRTGKQRLTVIHKNVKNVLNPITEAISASKINIANFLSQAQGDYAYAILDLDERLPETALKQIQSIKDVVKVRVIE
ncbi:MAG: 3-phosphoglycerate dehydrogenase family protein [Firmicutes bacterium]|nr:3-phosphoglycerate dehydrogenase family protein [Bacillota bacterium]